MLEKVYSELIARLPEPPVLMDVGASGDPPEIWGPISRLSTFVGFDPDSREIRDVADGRFRRTIIIDKAVTDRDDIRSVRFFLTKSPYCSSTLLPDAAALEHFVFSDLFIVENEVDVETTTLADVVKQIDVPGIDWLKLDTQGTDLRLFTTLPPHLRNRVLAVDVEPGLIDAYIGEDLFVDTHAALTKAGFWLSDLSVKGTVRVDKTTRDALQAAGSDIDHDRLQRGVRTSPGWCEGRYLRSIESLARHDASEREYLLLWVFSMIDGQLGFALDVAFALQARFGASPTVDLMITEASARVREAADGPADGSSGVRSDLPTEAVAAAPIETKRNTAASWKDWIRRLTR